MVPILADYLSFRDIVRRRLSEVQLVCSDECDRKLDFSPKAFAVALHESSFDRHGLAARDNLFHIRFCAYRSLLWFVPVEAGGVK